MGADLWSPIATSTRVPAEPANDWAARARLQALTTRLAQVICPSGGLLTGVSSPLCKNISVSVPPKSHLELCASHPTRGAYHDRHGRRGGMRWTRQRFARDGIAGRVLESVSDHRRADERCCCGRQNRVVLTPRRWRQVRGVASAQPGLDKTYPLMTVAREPGHRGEHEISR